MNLSGFRMINGLSKPGDELEAFNFARSRRDYAGESATPELVAALFGSIGRFQADSSVLATAPAQPLRFPVAELEFLQKIHDGGSDLLWSRGMETTRENIAHRLRTFEPHFGKIGERLSEIGAALRKIDARSSKLTYFLIVPFATGVSVLAAVALSVFGVPRYLLVGFAVGGGATVMLGEVGTHFYENIIPRLGCGKWSACRSGLSISKGS